MGEPSRESIRVDPLVCFPYCCTSQETVATCLAVSRPEHTAVRLSITMMG